MLRFLAVGSLAFAVDAGVLALAMTMGAGPALGRALSIPPALLTGFLLNRGWTFGAKGNRHILQQFLRYCVVQAGGIATNTGIYAAVLLLSERNDRLMAVIAVAAGSLGAMVVTFVGSRQIVFARPE